MQTVSVTALVLNFADACRALVPMLEGAAVPWGEGQQYDNWDRIAQPLFTTLVTEPCGFAAVGEANISRLDIAGYDYDHLPDCSAYIAVEGPQPQRLIGLTTKTRPFDMVKVVGEPEQRLRLRDCRFIFVYVGPDQTWQHLSEVDLDAV
jgi:hypothetical protein